MELLGTFEEFAAEVRIAQIAAGEKERELTEELIKQAEALKSGFSGADGLFKPSPGELEERIDALSPEAKGGDGSEFCRHMEKAWTILRRAERAAVNVCRFGAYPKEALACVNRLCDLVKTVSELPAGEKPSPAEKIPVDAPAFESPGILSDGLGLLLAKEMAEAAERLSFGEGKSVSITVCTAEGIPILMHMMDGAIPISADVSRKKAYTAAMLRMPTHEALSHSKEGGAFEGLTSGGDIILLGGGYPLKADGRVFGAVGVSGGTAAEDEKLAQFLSLYFEKRVQKMTASGKEKEH